MGCGSSMDANSIADDHVNNDLIRWQQNGQGSLNIIQEYVRLDEKIAKLEATCPGPRMATVEAWIEHLQVKRDSLLGIEGTETNPTKYHENNRLQNDDDVQILSLNNSHSTSQPHARHTILSTAELASNQQNGFILHANGGYGALTNTNNVNITHNHMNGNIKRLNGSNINVGIGKGAGSSDLVASTPNRDLANLALSLGVIGDQNKASTHEDFFANLSESALYLTSIRFYSEILEHNRVRLKKLTESYVELNELYLNQDGIIAFISGGTYMTRLEESIDSQLEIARDTRDKLGSILEQWRLCGTLLRACANSATLSLHQWRHLAKIIKPRDKVQAALECRNTLQASLVSLDCAQLALPHVEIKYVSNRQILAVKHCNIYMITDIANLSRYEHTSKVFASYESNMSKASVWLHETFNKTLRRDFDKAEETVRSLAKNLRDHREEVFTTARK